MTTVIADDCQRGGDASLGKLILGIKLKAGAVVSKGSSVKAAPSKAKTRPQRTSGRSPMLRRMTIKPVKPKTATIIKLPQPNQRCNKFVQPISKAPWVREGISNASSVIKDSAIKNIPSASQVNRSNRNHILMMRSVVDTACGSGAGFVAVFFCAILSNIR